jgi:hypothetical protein
MRKTMKNRMTQIDETTQNFKASFGSLTSVQMNWKPNPETWSIAQNIDHLIVINETYYPVIQAVRQGTYTLPFIGKIGFMVSFIGNMILKSVQPDRKRKIKTFPIWEPSTSEIPEGILGRFENHQSELKKLMEISKDLIERRTVISSPANRNIVYKLETAFDIIIIHERRHLEQAKEVLGMMEK